MDAFGAVSGAVAVFLAWAIGRELDPDNTASASIAMILALVAVLAAPPAAGVVAVAMIALRMIAGTVGLTLGKADYVVVIGLTAYAATRPEGWAVSILMIAAILVSRPSGYRRLAGIAGMAAVAAALITSNPIQVTFSSAALFTAFLTVAATLVIWPVGTVSSTVDASTRPVSSTRVAKTRLAAGATTSVAVLLSPEALTALSPLIVSLVAVAVVYLAREIASVSSVEGAGRAARVTEPAVNRD